MWLLAIIHEQWLVCGQPSSFVGGQLHFLGSCGGSAVVGGHWCSWVVKSIVGSSDEHGWW